MWCVSWEKERESVCVCVCVNVSVFGCTGKVSASNRDIVILDCIYVYVVSATSFYPHLTATCSDYLRSKIEYNISSIRKTFDEDRPDW